MSSRAITDLVPELQLLCNKLVDQSASEGHLIVVTQTYRTWEEQDALYAQGRSTPGKVVTNAPGGYSFHNFRRAFDVAFTRGPGDVTWEGPWLDLGDIGEEIGLVWGGANKGFPDLPHFELPGGFTLAQLRERELTDEQPVPVAAI